MRWKAKLKIRELLPLKIGFNVSFQEILGILIYGKILKIGAL